MKRIIALAGILLAAFGIFSCQNEELEFPDFDYTTAYFPYQYPVRTLVLGDYNFDNSNDNNLKFLISATMGGVYKNGNNIDVAFVVEEKFTENLFNTAGGAPIKALPKEYYTLSNNGKILIPKGELSGSVEVQLTEAFLADPLAIGQNYVIPLKMVSASTDSILQGQPGTLNPDPRIAGNWVIAPKDFTLFGIKYVNQYHGKYLLRGKSVVQGPAGNTLETIVYRQKYVEQNPVVSVKTNSRNTVLYSNSIRLTSGSPGAFEMQMAFDENGHAVLSHTGRFPHQITGTGKLVKNGDEWGGSKRNAIYLSYQIKQGANTHTVNDTLVFRDKDVRFEEFTPKIVK
jgi:hypothetical protein